MKDNNWLDYFWIVLLSIIFMSGIASSEISPIVVQNAHSSVMADFYADTQTGYSPCSIVFIDTSSGMVDNYEWDFGDGENSSERSPTHLYTNPGLYTVSLTISGSGGTDKKTRIGYITISEPVIISQPFEEIKPGNAGNIESPPDKPEDVEILSSIQTSSKSPLSQSGEEEKNQSADDNSSDKTLTIPDYQEVKADFSIKNPTGLVPLEITCSDSSTGNIKKWKWDFGDGTSSDAQSPIHVYQNSGNFTISLTVEGENGSNTMTKPNLISVIEPVSASFSAVKTEGVAPFDVRFMEDNSGLIIKRDWSFGDGMHTDTENPSHVYVNPGVYEVGLTVYGSHNDDNEIRPSYIIVHPSLPDPTPTTVSSQSTDTNLPIFDTTIENSSPIIELTTDPVSDVTNPEPSEELQNANDTVLSSIVNEPHPSSDVITSQPAVDFTITPVEGVAPLEISAKDISTGDITRWWWQFGDGNGSEGQEVMYRYEMPGDYLLNLTVFGPGSENGISKEQLIQVTIPPDNPSADFEVSSTEGTTPFSIVCTDKSTGEISDWIWDFGDGKVLRGRNPTHTYYEPGQYSITLSVKGPGGKDEIRKESHITVRQPELPLQASFICEKNRGYTPLEVAFHDTSSGNGTTWLWKFGDDTESTDKNPVHVYSTPGNYSVTLSVSNGDSNSSKTYDNIIMVEEKPVPVQASFSVSPMNGDAPLKVDYTDKSIGNISSWKWDFGDGSISSLRNPEHTYEKPGIYSVSLEISGDEGQDRSVRSNLISVLASTISPELKIEANPYEGDAPLSVHFSKNIIGETSCLWNFGDGFTSSELSPVHIFQKPGLYDISLSLYNGVDNRTITKNRFINVTEPASPPTADFITNITTGEAPSSVRCTDMSKGEISNWTWEFEKGVIVTSQDTVYTYDHPGNYSISLTVEGPGGRDSKSIDIEIVEPAFLINENITNENDNSFKLQNETINLSPLTIPEFENDTVSIVTPLFNPVIQDLNQTTFDNHVLENPMGSIEPFDSITQIFPQIFTSATNGSAPFSVQFNSSWSDEEGSFLWQFGDGESSHEREPVHTYKMPGLYSIRLAYENQNKTEEIIKNNYIEVLSQINPPNISFTAQPRTGNVPLKVSFSNNSTGNITQCTWNLGDGTVKYGENLTHIFTKPGNYTVGLNVTGPDGSFETIYEDCITVFSPKTPQKADFIADMRAGNAPLIVNFSDQSIGVITGYNWTFGDGTVSNEKSPSHQYDKTGIYTVNLLISGPDGSDSVTRRGYIVVNAKPDPLVARFNVSPITGDAPLIIQCTSTSSGIIKRYLWEFGDGAVSENKNPSHQYKEPGVYMLKLTTYGNSGLSSADQIITVGPVLLKDKENSAHSSYQSEVMNLTHVPVSYSNRAVIKLQ